MTRENERVLRRRRRRGLEIHTLAGETLVYDLERHRAHRLNRVASIVLRCCDGVTDREGARAALRSELGVDVDAAVVDEAVRRLDGARLLEPGPPATPVPRRVLLERLGRLGVVGATLLPVVTTLVAPPPAEAVSCVPHNGCAGRPNCTPCANPGGHCGQGKWKCWDGQCLNPGQAKQRGC